MKTFYTLLANNAVAAVTNFTVWFALTFWVFLETESVFATGMIAGVHLTLTAVSGFWFGSLVDHYRKKSVMMLSSAISFIAYAASLGLFLITPAEAFTQVTSPELWILIVLLIAGVIAGNMRNIAMPTIVTMVVPDDHRDKANGLVGMITGLSFGTVSVISGLLIGFGGMFWVFVMALPLTLAALIHLLLINIEEREIVHVEGARKSVDIRGTLVVLAGIPGIFALILFTTFNNFLGGVFMALMDAYGLSLVSVEVWGLLLGVLSFSFMLGGIAIAKFGLGKNPLRSMLLANVVVWISCIFFTIQPSIILLVLGMFVWMFTFPFIEASEHTVLQKVVPFERQGRVFGFAQSVEQMASPLTAFLIGPLTQFFFIPLMTTGLGAELIGTWFGTGADRGIALVFTITGIIGLAVTLLAFVSRPYRNLSKHYQETSAPVPA